MIKEKIKYNWGWVLFYLLFLAFTLMLIVVMNSHNTGVYFNLIKDSYGIISAIIVILISFIYFLLLKNIDKKEIKLEKIFLYISIPIGILYMLLLPFDKIPDEKAHFFRSYSISKGNFIADVNEDGIGGNNLPFSIHEMSFLADDTYTNWFERVSSKTTDSKEVFSAFPNTSLYFFITYIPQALGIFIGDLFTDNLLVLIYFGRAFNLMTFIALIYFSIKLIPFKKIAIMFFSFLPMVFQEAASLAADGLAIAIIFFFVSYILNLKYEKEKIINKKDIIILLLSSIVIAVVKIVYLPICLSVFLLSDEKFKSKKQKYVILIGIVLISVIINLTWLAYTSKYTAEMIPNVQPIEQAKYILTNPFEYILIVLKTTNMHIEGLIGNILGNSLGILDISISNIYKYILIFVLAFPILMDNKEENFVDNKTKIILLICLIAVIALIYTSEYIKWTPYKQHIIDGLQGRYFIPLLILLPFIFNNNYIVTNKKIPYRMVLMFMVFLNLHALTSILYTVMM